MRHIIEALLTEVAEALHATGLGGSQRKRKLLYVAAAKEAKRSIRWHRQYRWRRWWFGRWWRRSSSSRRRRCWRWPHQRLEMHRWQTLFVEPQFWKHRL